MTSRFFNRVMPNKKGGFEVSPTPAINRNSVDATPTGGTNLSNGYSRGTPQRRSTVAHQPPSANSPRTSTIRHEMKAAASPNPVKRFQVQGNTGPYPETRTEVPGSTVPHQTPVETRYEVPVPHPTTSELVSDAIHFAQNSKNTTPKRLPPTPVQTPTQYEELDRIGNYQLIKTIGKGNFAKVKLAKHIPTGQQVAIKMIDKTQLSESDLKKLYREVRIMKRLNHPNIVKLYEILEDDRYLHLVLEYASKGEIFDYVVSRGRLQEADARKKFRQIISAIHYCHKNNIVHRDLKAENLLLDEDMNLKIADFGFSNEFTSGHKLNTFCGSPPYAAPELFQGKKYDGPEVDVWSLGVILYTMVSGSLPFDGRTIKDLKERIVKGRYQIPFFMTAECEQMLRKFLVINPARRTTLENAMQEKWINLGYDGRELKPYEETTSTLDEDCIDSMVEMGYNREDIRQSLDMLRYDHLYATYHLLVTKSSPVRGTVSRTSMGQSLQRTPLRRSIQNGDVIHTTPIQPSAAPTGGPSSAPVPPPRTRRLKPGVDNNVIKNNKPSGVSVRRTPSNVERPSNDVIYATPSNNNTNGYVNGKHEPDLKTTYSRATANNQRRMRSPSSDSQNRMSIRQTGNNAAVLNQYRMRSPSSDSQNRISTRQSVVQTNPRGSQRYDSRPGNTATLPSSNPRQLPTSGAQRGVEYITNPQNSRISAHRRNPSVDNQRPINSTVPKRSTTPSNLVSTSIVTDPRQGRNRDVRTGLSSRAASQTIPSAINTSTNHIFSDFDSVSMSRQGSIRSTCSISVTPTKFIRQNPARQTVDGRSTAVSPNIIYLPPDKVGKVEMKSRSRFPFFDRFKFSNKR